MRIIKLFLIIAVFALSLVSTGAFAGRNPNSNKCESVKAVWYLTDYQEGEGNCGVGFTYCIFGTLTGQPNGEMIYFGNDDPLDGKEMLNPFGTDYEINIAVGEEHISTQNGDIYTISHTLYDYDSGVWTELLNIYGGTGMYERATGQMVFGTQLPPSRNKPIAFEGPAVLTGYICTH